MAKKEFNDKSGPLKSIYDILGIQHQPLSPEERKALQQVLDDLRKARANDPLFDEKAFQAWVKAEAAADPDAFDDLTAGDLLHMLQETISPKFKGPKRRK